MSLFERVWGWFQVKVLGRSDIYFGSSLYMRRWRIGPKWGLGLRIHHTVRGDSDREFHDHPFWFVSLILRGGYVEHRPGHPPRSFKPGRFVFHRATDMHRLDLSRPAWTLVLRGPFKREWGFLSETGWISWRDHIDRRKAKGKPGKYAAHSSVK